MRIKMIINILNLITLIATLIVLCFYTSETYKLRLESQKQTDALWRPLVDYEGKPPWNLENFPIKLLNLGNGIAKNITGYLILGDKKYNLCFSTINEEKMCVDSFEGLGTVEFFKTGIHIKIKKEEYEKLSKTEQEKVFLKYQNINDKWYATEILKENGTRFFELQNN